MSLADVDTLSQILAKTSVGETGVSFQGRSLKLDTEHDAVDIIKAINNCEKLEFLNLEGNTLGVDAAKGVAKALEAHKEFKRALWKDMFTGRMKEEIPKALQYLGCGLVLAKARLSELDLSDNAFGPIGVEGLAALLRSSSCYALQVLKLNNNGLGITGGRLLSTALLDCYENSKAVGQPLALRVFIAGRNRLENEGAKALSKVFKLIGSLEELIMPQNGIYHTGISALCEALMVNPNLRVLNFNDNTVTVKGAMALAKALPVLQKLRQIDLGDCLLKTDGATLLASALGDQHMQLEEVNLSFNEIKVAGSLSLVEALRNKPHLKHLLLEGNQFGGTGREEIRSRMQAAGKLDVLGSLSGDEDDSEEEENDESEEEESDESESNDEAENVNTEQLHENKLATSIVQNGVVCSGDQSVQQVSVMDFMKSPSLENFKSLGVNKAENMLEEVKKRESDPIYQRFLLELLMKVSALSACSEVFSDVIVCSNLLYKALFEWMKTRQGHEYGICTNELMVFLGLMKSEDKLKLTWNTDNCVIALNEAIRQEFFPHNLKEMLRVFFAKKISNDDDDIQILTSLN